MPKHQLYLVELEDDASAAKAYHHMKAAPGTVAADGIRLMIPGAEVTAFGTAEEWYGAKLLLKAAVQRDIIHTILRRRGVGMLKDGELAKIGEIAHKFVEGHPEMLAIRVQYEDELAAQGISLKADD